MHGIADEESINSLLKEMEEDINSEGNTIIVNETGGGEIGGGEDKAPITVDITENGITSSSITVKVAAKGTNIGTNLTYKYYIKSTSEKTYPEVADYTGTDATYRFIELTHGAGYDIKVEVENAEGKKGVGYLTGQITNRVAGSEITGAIDFEEATWNNGLANVRVSTNTGYDIEYRKGSSGTWLPLANGGTIQDIANNTVIQVHLTDGTNTGNEATITVKDITPPTINNITVTNKTETSLQITVNAEDYESGLATSNTYTYSIDGGTGVPSNSNIKEFTGLTAGTKYLLKVEVKDRVGNKASDMIMETTTEKEYQTAGALLKNGDIVKYKGKYGDIYPGVVLYSASSQYGLQIVIRTDAYASFYSGSIETDVQRVNDSSKYLNGLCQSYLNENIATKVRHFGTNPSQPDVVNPTFNESLTYPSWIPSGIKVRNPDSLGDTDYNTLSSEGARSLGKSGDTHTFVVLSPSIKSLYINSSNFRVTFFVYNLGDWSGSGKILQNEVMLEYTSSSSNGGSYQLFPCISLKPETRVFSRRRYYF